MPGIPLVARETIQSRNGDQPFHQDPRMHLSAEEAIAAEESLTVYCKPVEFYNILQRRAIRNPLFLQRCLRYKIQAKHSRRIQMSVSLSGTLDDESKFQSLLPVHIMLARLVSDIPNSEHSAVYRYTKAHMLTTAGVEEGAILIRADFVLPEMNKLIKEVKSGSLFILFVSYGAAGTNISSGSETAREHLDNLSSSSNIEKTCSWGKISLESLLLSWERFPNLNPRGKAEMLSTVDLHPCILKSGFREKENCISFKIPECSGSMTSLQQMQVVISAEERGVQDFSPYNSYKYIPASASPNVLRLRSGNVIFNYKYYQNKLQRTEVTEDFTCPFCLVKCASFKGVKLHLLSSHDLFNFEFWMTEEYQAVNVSVKLDRWRPEIVADGIDPKQLIFFFSYKPLKRRKMKRPIDEGKHVQPLTLTSDMHAAASELLNKIDDANSSRVERARSSSVNDSQNAVPDPDCTQSITGSSLAPPAMLQFAKTRKLSIERSECRSRALLEKRQFFHSHRAQPMVLEQVLSDHDSEDEVDDDVADLEDRRMLDDFVDVTRDEKQIMHLWNSFVRKQRVIADGHIPWACEAFSRMHGPNLVKAPALIWCWRMFMIKLWNHGLLDARAMNNCNLILEECQKQGTNPP